MVVTESSFHDLRNYLAQHLTDCVVEGFGSGGVCINTAYHFFDFLIHPEDTDKTHEDVFNLLSEIPNKISILRFSKRCLRLWVYWDKCEPHDGQSLKGHQKIKEREEEKAFAMQMSQGELNYYETELFIKRINNATSIT